MCHVLLLLPIFALPLFVFLPRELALILYVAVSVASAALYWLLWRTMQRPAATGIEGMMGGIETVFQPERGKAKVFYHGEIWDALSKERISTGEQVDFVGFDEMKLLVRRPV